MTTINRPLRLTQPDQMPTPIVDDLSATVLDEAIDTLARLRTPYWLGDSAVHLHALASLLAQGQALLSDAVAQARDQDFTWDQIGELLGLTGRPPQAATGPPPPPARRLEPCTPQRRPSPRERRVPRPLAPRSRA